MEIFLITILFLLVLLYLLFLFFAIKTLVLAVTIFWGAPFVPAPDENVDQMLKILDLKQGEVFFDLGSGDGRIVIKAALKYGVEAVGIEINPFLIYLSQRKVRKLGLQDKIKIVWGSFFKKDLSRADAIAVYLTQPIMKPLEKKLLSELRPKTRIVSKYFTFENIFFVKSDPENPEIKLYKIF